MDFINFPEKTWHLEPRCHPLNVRLPLLLGHPQPSGSELTGEGQETRSLARGHRPCPTSTRDLGECPSSLAVSRDEQAKPELQEDARRSEGQQPGSDTSGGTQGASREPVSRTRSTMATSWASESTSQKGKGSRRTLRPPASSGLGSVIYRLRFERRDSCFLAPAFLVHFISRSRWRKGLRGQGREQPSPSPLSWTPASHPPLHPEEDNGDLHHSDVYKG